MSCWLVRIALAGGIALLALASLLAPGLKAAGPQKSDMVVQVLGGAAEFASEQAYHSADVYYHGGTNHDHHDHDCHDADLPLMDVIRRLHEKTAPRDHRHLEGEEEKELIPWFTAAVRLNPHNIDAWRTGAYWYYRTGDPINAEEFISDAIRHNPKDYRLYFDRGVLHHRMERWDKAVIDLEVAVGLWRDDLEESFQDLPAIHTYLKKAHEQLDD